MGVLTVEIAEDGASVGDGGVTTGEGHNEILHESCSFLEEEASAREEFGDLGEGELGRRFGGEGAQGGLEIGHGFGVLEFEDLHWCVQESHEDADVHFASFSSLDDVFELSLEAVPVFDVRWSVSESTTARFVAMEDEGEAGSDVERDETVDGGVGPEESVVVLLDRKVLLRRFVVAAGDGSQSSGDYAFVLDLGAFED